MRGSVILLLAFSLSSNWARADALERLRPDRLVAVRKAVRAFEAERRALAPVGPYRDYRANLHVHSVLSHDSRGSLAEILAAARKVGTRIPLFTEHPAETYDYFADGHRGEKDGVLLIPGAET